LHFRESRCACSWFTLLVENRVLSLLAIVDRRGLNTTRDGEGVTANLAVHGTLAALGHTHSAINIMDALFSIGASLDKHRDAGSGIALVDAVRDKVALVWVLRRAG